MKRRTFLGAALAAVSFAASIGLLAARAVAGQLSAFKPEQRGIRLPPLPKWNKATDDIDCNDFARRSQDYERSLLPRDLIFPRAGQIWQAVRDCEVSVLQWTICPIRPVLVPNARLRQGERVRVLTLDDPKPLQVAFEPVRYEELRQTIAPDSLRYQFSMRMAPTGPAFGQQTGYFHDLFRLVEDAA